MTVMVLTQALALPQAVALPLASAQRLGPAPSRSPPAPQMLRIPFDSTPYHASPVLRCARTCGVTVKSRVEVSCNRRVGTVLIRPGVPWFERAGVPITRTGLQLRLEPQPSEPPC